MATKPPSTEFGLTIHSVCPKFPNRQDLSLNSATRSCKGQATLVREAFVKGKSRAYVTDMQHINTYSKCMHLYIQYMIIYDHI